MFTVTPDACCFRHISVRVSQPKPWFINCVWSSASLCLGGSDIFASVRENSPMGQFISNLSISGEPGANAVRLCLTGDNADWFYLEGRTIRLNASVSRVLDREVRLDLWNMPHLHLQFDHLSPGWSGRVFVSQVQGSVLIAELTCYEDDVIQVGYLSDINNSGQKNVSPTVNELFVSSESVQDPGGDPEWKWQQTELPGGDDSPVHHQWGTSGGLELVYSRHDRVIENKVKSNRSSD